VTSISIDNGRRSRRLHRTAADNLAATLMATSASVQWANGTLSMGAHDIEDLYKSVERELLKHALD